MISDRLALGVKRALAYGGDTHSLQDVMEMVASGKAQAWHGRESLIVTMVHKYPRKKVCQIWLATGSMEELTEEMEPAICEWARAKGCDAIVINGRVGWERVMKDYRTQTVELAKDLRNE